MKGVRGVVVGEGYVAVTGYNVLLIMSFCNGVFASFCPVFVCIHFFGWV